MPRCSGTWRGSPSRAHTAAVNSTRTLPAAFALTALLAGCSAPAPGTPAEAPAAPEEEAAPGVITYEVGGTATQATNVTYTDGGTQTSQETGATVPWTKQVPEADGPITVYQVIAQNAGGGDITCRILGAYGAVLAENTSTGEYAVVTCNS